MLFLPSSHHPILSDTTTRLVWVCDQVSGILSGVRDTAPDRQRVEGYSVDSKKSGDLDDAIHVERHPEGGYCIFVHISDVSEAIKILSPIDQDAHERVVSLYHGANGVTHMLPQELATGVLSLGYGGKEYLHPTVTLEVHISAQGDIRSYQFYESLMTNVRRYDFASFYEARHSSEERDHKKVALMEECARVILRGEVAQRLPQERSRLYLREDLISSESREIGAKYAQSVVQPYMLLANHLAASYMSTYAPEGVFRLQLSPEELAYYARHPWEHVSIPLNFGRPYTHFTSPIRRLIDLVVHRIIKACIREDDPPYTTQVLTQKTDHINQSLTKAHLTPKATLSQKDLIERYRQRMERDPGANDFAQQIRHSVTHSEYALPREIRDLILSDIQTHADPDRWYWAVGLILLLRDSELLAALHDATCREKKISPKKFLSLLAHTRRIRWEECCFHIETYEVDDEYMQISVWFQGDLIVDVMTEDLDDSEHARWSLRSKAVQAIFTYFTAFFDVVAD